jgi:DNA-binding HxlR family transcriptional regulator
MKSKKSDIEGFILQLYVLDLLRALKTPKRFNDLTKTIKNKGTLTIKLTKMKDLGLIKVVPRKIDGVYTNSYVMSKKGKVVLNKLEEII